MSQESGEVRTAACVPTSEKFEWCNSNSCTEVANLTTSEAQFQQAPGVHKGVGTAGDLFFQLYSILAKVALQKELVRR